MATLDDLAVIGVEALALRYLCLTVHYSRKLNLSDESVAAAAAGLASLRARLRSLGPPPDDGPWRPPVPLPATPSPARPEGIASGIGGHGDVPSGAQPAAAPHEPPLSSAGRELRDQFAGAVHDDLDLPRALATVRDGVRSGLAPDEARWLTLSADAVLGLDLHRAWEPRAAVSVGAGVDDLVARRRAARQRRDFDEADRLRVAIREHGYDVVDRDDGSTELVERLSREREPAIAR